MAKHWAIRFYKSAAWQKCRAAYISFVFGLCERCGEAGKIVHHQIVLTPSNINDPSISLNHEHLEYLCQLCHNKEHHGSGDVVGEGLQFDSNGNLIERVMM